MNKDFYVFDANNLQSTFIDASVDATHQTNPFVNAWGKPLYGSYAVMAIAYDSSGDPVTPTSGTVGVTGATLLDENGDPLQTLDVGSGDAVIDATKMIAGKATYSMPVALGKVNRGVIDVAGFSANVATIQVVFAKVE